jgi:hypothetical protein
MTACAIKKIVNPCTGSLQRYWPESQKRYGDAGQYVVYSIH